MTIWLVATYLRSSRRRQARPNLAATSIAIKSDEGDPITNFDLKPELSARLAKLPGQVAVGNPNDDVTLVQFYDLNCPFCREAAADLDALVRADKSSNWCRANAVCPCSRLTARSSSLRRVRC